MAESVPVVTPVPKTPRFGASDECLSMRCKQSHVPCVPTLRQETLLLEKPLILQSQHFGGNGVRDGCSKSTELCKKSNKDGSSGDTLTSPGEQLHVSRRCLRGLGH